MKKIFCILCIFIFSLNCFSQNSEEENIIVFNEDFNQGRELFQLNKPEEAIPFFEKCLDVENIDPAVYIYLGVAYYQTGDFTKSLSVCSRGLTKENTDHKILAYNAGNSAYALGNYARADACYAISINADPDFSPAYLNRANSQLKQDRLQDAKENYEKYIELEPDDLQKEKIEQLIILLDEEIARRAKEKPEMISLDDFALENSDVSVGEDIEKVEVDILEETKERTVIEEIVTDEIAMAPALPVYEEEEEIQFEIENSAPPEMQSGVTENISSANGKQGAESDEFEKITVLPESENIFGEEKISESSEFEEYEKVSLPLALNDDFEGVENTALSVSLSSDESFSPDGDGINDELKIRIKYESRTQISYWKIRIENETGLLFIEEKRSPPPEIFVWNGKTASGKTVGINSTVKYSVELKNESEQSASAAGEAKVISSIPAQEFK